MAKMTATVFLAAVVLLPAWLARAGQGGPPPGAIVLDSLVDRYQAVRFDHPMHVMLAGECAKCHHTHPTAASTCNGCHDVAPEQFRQTAKAAFLPCGSCHGKAGGASVEVPSLKVAYHRACFSCHRDMGVLGAPENCALTCHNRTHR
ncbi:MAG: cytochrome c3 family protein [Nitrospirota bacterium]|jgi:hypothetical protein